MPRPVRKGVLLEDRFILPDYDNRPAVHGKPMRQGSMVTLVFGYGVWLKVGGTDIDMVLSHAGTSCCIYVFESIGVLEQFLFLLLFQHDCCLGRDLHPPIQKLFPFEVAFNEASPVMYIFRVFMSIIVVTLLSGLKLQPCT